MCALAPPHGEPRAQADSANCTGLVSDAAIRLAAAGDTNLRFVLTTILGDLAEALGATQVALLSLIPDRAAICEVEYAAAGSRLISGWLGSLEPVDQRQFASAVEESSFDAVSSNLLMDGMGPGQVLAASVKCAESKDASAALIFRFPASLFVGPQWFRQFQGVLDLLGSVFSRIASERVRAEQQSQLASQAVAGQAAIALAHDFNNVLYTIQCVTDVLLLETDRSSRIRVDLEEIKNATHRGASITRHLVALGKPRGTFVEHVDLGDTLTRFLPIVQRILGPHITIRLALPIQPLKTMTDRATLERLLLESILVMHPRSADPHSFGISLQSTANDTSVGGLEPGRFDTEWVELVIGADNDDGFWDFSGALGSEATLIGLVPPGTLVKRTKSRIQVSLPYCRPTSDTDSVSSIFVPDVPQDATILLVEDEETARKATARILSRVGYRVLEASGQKQAIGILSESAHLISALVTDVVLPDGSGVSIYDKLRSSSGCVKAIFVSGFGPGILRDHGLSENDFWFLQKPYRVSELQRLLQTVLAHSP